VESAEHGSPGCSTSTVEIHGAIASQTEREGVRRSLFPRPVVLRTHFVNNGHQPAEDSLVEPTGGRRRVERTVTGVPQSDRFGLPSAGRVADGERGQNTAKGAECGCEQDRASEPPVELDRVQVADSGETGGGQDATASRLAVRATSLFTAEATPAG
jgi:hypothetical protein